MYSNQDFPGFVPDLHSSDFHDLGIPAESLFFNSVNQLTEPDTEKTNEQE